MFRIPLYFSPDAGYKSNRFSKTLSEKSLEFVLNKRNNTIIFNLSLILLSEKVDFISEEQNRKKNMLGVCGIDHIKMTLVLMTKIIALYIKATIV